MPNWQVEVTGLSNRDTRFFQGRFDTSALRIIGENNRTWLISKQFRELTEVEDVRGVATQLLRVAVGISRFHYVDVALPGTGEIRHWNPNGTIEVYPVPIVFESQRSSHARAGRYVGPDANVYEKPQLPSAVALVELAQRDSRVGDALTHFSSVNDWWSMYKVFEVLAAAFGGQDSKLAAAGIARMEDLDNFRRTANDFRTGYEARHAVPRKHPPPATRLSLEDGKLLLAEMLHRWISKRWEEELASIAVHKS